MKNVTFAVVISMALALGGSAFAQTNNLKVGKTGQFTLKQEAKVGGTLLAPGNYEVRQRSTSTGHYMEFTLVTEQANASESRPFISDYRVVAKIPCSMEALNTPVARTSEQISNGTVAQLKSLEIRGENVEHLF